MNNAGIRFEDGKVRVSGELTFSTVTTLLGQSKPLFAQAGESIEVELGEVERADSAGVAILIEWMRRAKEQGSTIRFSHLPEQLSAIAATSDLEEILPLEHPQEAGR